MERTVIDAVSSPPTLKREDCQRTKHGSAFFNWKILIGAGDWEDYMLNKEGAERYRTHNLPNCNSCPGLYEFGIVIPQKDGKIRSNLRSKDIIPVYLGQADNIRTRLQQYGRDGAHLENCFSNGKLIDRKVVGLFSDIFANGFAIAYRWAPEMNIFPPKRKGLSIKHCDPTVLEYGLFYTMTNDIKVPFGIFKIGRSRPTLVSKESDMNNSDVGICGADLGHGFICTHPPVAGRKRCVGHKGMKVKASIRPRLHTNIQDIGQDKHYIPTLEIEPFCIRQKGCEVVKHKEIIVNGKKPMISDADSLSCAAITLDGSSCQRKPSKDSKFCWQHEPVRSGLLTNTHDICPWEKVKISGVDSLTCAAITLSGSSCQRKPSKDSKFCWQHEPVRSGLLTNTHDICPWEKVKISGVDSLTCAAITLSGSSCQRKPSEDSKFCWQHEPMRSCLHTNTRNICRWETVKILGAGSLTCAAITRSGSYCRRKPSNGSKYCWQH